MLDETILALIKQQEQLGGVDVSKLKPDTRIKLRTQNTEYNITVIEKDKIVIQGGRFFPTPMEGRLNGSTWGGSMIKLNWIGFDMRMELVFKEGRIQTSPVKNVIVSSNDWQYELEWESDPFGLNEP